jgi:hypothetical protein
MSNRSQRRVQAEIEAPMGTEDAPEEEERDS